VCVSVWLCVCEREREIECVWESMCVREKEREAAVLCSALFARSKGVCVSKYLCVCMCVRFACACLFVWVHEWVDVSVYNILQCVAVCCSVLQCVAVCCSVLCQCRKWGTGVAECCRVLQCVAVCCSALHCVAAGKDSSTLATNHSLSEFIGHSLNNLSRKKDR